MKGKSVSSRLRYRGLFDEEELQVAEAVVSEFCGPGKAFPHDEFETLLHDVLTTWHSERETHDAARGASLATYMRKVVRRDLLDRVKGVKSGKHRIIDEARSLLDPLGDDNNPLTLEEVLKSRDPLSEGTVDIRINLAEALPQLNPRQRRIIKLHLTGLTMTEIAAVLKVSRSTIHDEITRIRKFFECRDLRDYLE